MFCHQCGIEAKAEARYCHACGKPLEVVQEVPAAPTPAAPVTRPERADTGLHPWRRFFARTIDLLFAVLLLVALYVILLLWFPSKEKQIVGALTNPITAAVIIYWLWVPVEAAFLATIGTTPAKWIFGIRVVKFDGRKLTFAEALKRAAFACILGDGLGIPGAALFTRAYAYDRLKKTETTAWDKACGSVVKHSQWGVGRVIGATVIVAAALIVFSVLTAMDKKQDRSIDATPRQAQSATQTPPAQSGDRASSKAESNNEGAGQIPVAQHFDRVKYQSCLKEWHAKNKKEWVEYVKRKTTLDGELKQSTYWPDDAAACDPFGNHAAEPKDRGTGWASLDGCFGGMFDETCDPALAQRKRQSEGFVSALDSSWEDYRHCVQKWQGDHHSQWLDFKDRWRAGDRSGALKATAFTARPDLKACESRIPRIK